MGFATKSFSFNLKIAIANIERNSKKLKLIFICSLAIFISLIPLKFLLKKQDDFPTIGMLDEINCKVQDVLKLKTREEQNTAFAKLKFRYPVVPIRMTLTTAVFKISNQFKSNILKRIIYNRDNGLAEDKMSMSLSSPYLVRTKRTVRQIWDPETGEYTKVDSGQNFMVILWVVYEHLDVKISQKSVGSDEKIIRAIITDCLKGLEYMHSKGIAHLDIKIGNIMGKRVPEGVVYKIIDFGYSQDVSPQGFMIIPKKNYGTYPYKPPEIVYDHRHGLASDIWSLGAACWFLSLGYTPFYKDNFEKDSSKYAAFLKDPTVTGDARHHRFFYKEKASREIRHFIEYSMAVNPDNRPTPTQLLKHPFITGEPLESFSVQETDEGYVSDSGESSTAAV